MRSPLLARMRLIIMYSADYSADIFSLSMFSIASFCSSFVKLRGIQNFSYRSSSNSIQYNRVLKEIAVINASATIRDGCTRAYITELLPRDTGLKEVAYQLSICFDRNAPQFIHLRKVENAVAYLDEYLAQHMPQKGFIFFNCTGLED